MSDLIDRVLVETTPRAMRVALMAGDRLVELHVDRPGRGHRVGDVFAGRVTRVVAGLNAAFIDLGGGVTGFLPARDASPDGASSDTIARLVHEGEAVSVQITKEATAEKGPKVTRRFADPDGAIAQTMGKADPACLIMRRRPLVLDLIERSPQARITVDSPSELARLKKSVDSDRLDQHWDGTNLFAHAGVDEQIDRALASSVDLPSGAHLIFEPGRTLTAVDVDMASAGERGADPFGVNLEAAAELAHQLRLRNIGGLIVVDFLNLKGEDKAKNLAEALRRSVADDPAEVALVGPSRFGLIEMARERRGEPLVTALGSAVEQATDRLVRELRSAAAGAGTLEVRASPAVVDELRRQAAGKDVASWVGRRLEIEIEVNRADEAFAVAAL